MDTTEKRTPYMGRRGLRDGSVTVDKLAEDVKQAIENAAEAQKIDSVTASVDNTVGTPSAEVSLVDGAMTFAFHNIKGETGEQGIQGTSAIWDGDAEVLTELEHTMGTATNKVMSQKAVTDELKKSQFVVDRELDSSLYSAGGLYVNNNGKYAAATSQSSVSWINATTQSLVGKTLRLTPQSSNYVRICCVSNTPTAGNVVTYTKNFTAGSTDQILEFVVPTNTAYVGIQKLRSSTDIQPAKIEVCDYYAINDVVVGINAKINTGDADLQSKITNIEEVKLNEYGINMIYNAGTYISGSSYVENTTSSAGGILAATTTRPLRGKYLRLTSQEGKIIKYAFLTNYPSKNTTPTYSEGYAGLRSMTGTKDIWIPTDCMYFYIKTKENSADIKPSKIEAIDDVAMVDVLSDISTIKGDINDTLAEFTQYSFGSLSSQSGKIDEETLRWSTDSSHYRLPVQPGEEYILKKTGTYSCVYAIMAADNAVTNNGYAHIHADYYRLYKFNWADTDPSNYSRVKIPAGATYLYIWYGNNHAPDAIYYKRVSKSVSAKNVALGRIAEVDASARRLRAIADIPIPSSIQLDENGWEIPQTLQQANVIKFADRMRFLKWTPKRDVPRKDGNTYPADEQQTGTPYSSNMQDIKFPGLTVSIYTYLTAINNPYSLQYTENISRTNSQSAWGRSYWNANGYAYYGNVCCSYTGICVGSHLVTPNEDHPTRARRFDEWTQLSPLREFHPELLKIGDVFDDDAHSLVIYGIKRDSSGNVTHVRYAEQTSAGIFKARYCIKSVDDFDDYVKTHPFAHYRYNRLAENYHFDALSTDPTDIVLTQSSGYDVTSSTASQTDPDMSNEICTFAGDKASFAQGDLVVINYNLNGVSPFDYTKIKVYKDETLLETYTIADIDQSELPEGQRGHALNLGTALLPGKYYAVCATDDAESDEKTEWEVIGDNSLSVDLFGDVLKVGFSKRCYFLSIGYLDTWTYSAPRPRAVRSFIPTYWQDMDGFIETNIKDLIGNKYYYLDHTYTLNDMYIFVNLQGDYGIVRIAKKLVEDE